MAQWLEQEQYGNGSKGDKVLSGTFGTNYGYVAAFTGTSGASQGSATNANFAQDQICIIHQTQRIGQSVSYSGLWEINVISGYSSGTVSLKYALDRTYYTGAQIIAVPQYRNLTGSLTLPTWSNSSGYGGVGLILASDTINLSTLTGSGKGFRGGMYGVNQNSGYRGETYNHVYNYYAERTQKDGAGGGGRAYDTHDSGAAGGGGGHAQAGQNGGSYNGDPGRGGTTYGTATLSSIYMGAGGGGNGMDTALVPIYGSYGGGIWFVFGSNITGGTINAKGTDATTTGYAGGGGGAGGSIYLAGNKISGINTYVDGGAQGGVGGWNARGGYGGYGRVAVKYGTSQSISGYTSGISINTSQSSDYAVGPRGGFFGGVV